MIIAAAWFTLAQPVSAQESAAALNFKPAPTDFWRTSAQMDVEAAYRMLRDDHPGAAPEVGDAGFRATLESAHAEAAARAAQVGDYAGYAATLAGFANAFGDKHVRSRPQFVFARPDWAGLIIAKRGERWVVADEDAAGPADSLLGAQLVSCDGRTPADWGKQVLGGFRADWSVEAQQEQTAPWLLVSEHNPFVPRPVACVFDKDGAHREVRLAWRSIRRDALTPRLEKAVGAGAAGFGVRKVGEGYWIALQGLDNRAGAVVDAVRADAEAMRTAPFVVLDLRGNGGGSSEYGRLIAEALYGAAYLDAVLGPEDSDCGSAWRVSPANMRELEHYQVMFADRGPEFVKIFKDLLDQAHAAVKAGRAFSAPLTCAAAQTRSGPVPASTLKGRMFLLTDGICFSSCLAVVDDFRHLGAVQLGRATDGNTHYAEVNDRPMPSGLSTFSTMMAVSASIPLRLGPFAPRDVFDGDIADTAAVQAWAESIAKRP